MLIRAAILSGTVGAALLLAACRDQVTGPLQVSVPGGPPKLVNPNREPLDAPSAFLIEAAAQGLVRFNAAGQIEPALAQRWIVSDDGLRYTFRLARAEWPNGSPATAEQVVERLRAVTSPSSRNPLKPLLGAIEEIEAMTDDVIEITLRAPRPYFLQLLAQPEIGILRNGGGTGPYRAEPRPDGSLLLTLPEEDEDEDEDDEDAFGERSIVLRGERTALAVARFQTRGADMVTGGTVGDLPIARAAEPADEQLRFDPVAGLFGLAVISRRDELQDAEVRGALSMAIDRAAMVAALAVPGLQARETLLPPALNELPAPRAPAWSASPFPARRAAAARVIEGLAGEEPFSIRVEMPEGPGYRLVFAHLKRDWRLIGVEAEAVRLGSGGDLRLIDAVAAAELATWYLRRFTCDASRICDPEADKALDAARLAPNAAERRTQLAAADRLLTELSPFLPIAAPVRWSLVGPRVNGFRPNLFGIHAAGELLARQP